MNCGYPNCRYKSKRFGVCGKHKGHAYEYDETEKDYKEYLKDLEKYKEIITRYKNAADELQNKGLNILSIQSCYNNNLCGPKVTQFPDHLKNAGESIDYIRLLQTKYNNIVISNVTFKIIHKILDGDNCKCMICNFGKNR